LSDQIEAGLVKADVGFKTAQEQLAATGTAYSLFYPGVLPDAEMHAGNVSLIRQKRGYFGDGVSNFFRNLRGEEHGYSEQFGSFNQLRNRPNSFFTFVNHPGKLTLDVNHD